MSTADAAATYCALAEVWCNFGHCPYLWTTLPHPEPSDND